MPKFSWQQLQEKWKKNILAEIRFTRLTYRACSTDPPRARERAEMTSQRSENDVAEKADTIITI